VHRLVGSTARNWHAAANRLHTDRRIFAIRIGDEYRYPAFQFDAEGRPLPVMRKLLRAADGLEGWGLALWLTAPNGFLDGRTPLDLLHEAPDQVIEAATAITRSDLYARVLALANDLGFIVTPAEGQPR
jgi:hypothetical protein